MTDGIRNINPFTGIEASQWELDNVDANHDGEITQDEWDNYKTRYVYYTPEKASDENVSFDNDLGFLDALSKDGGVKEFVDNTNDFNSQIQLMSDKLIEIIKQKYKNISEDQLAKITEIVASVGSELIAKLPISAPSLTSQPLPNIDMKSVALEFENEVTKRISEELKLNDVNMFTGLSLSTKDIEIIDKNGDGKLSLGEWLSVASSYTPISAGEGEDELAINEQSSFLHDLSSSEESKEFVNSVAEFNEQIDNMIDVYWERYLTDHYLEGSEKTMAKKWLDEVGSDFKTQYASKVGKNFDMKSVAVLFEQAVDTKFKAKADMKAANQQNIDTYVDNTEFSLLNLYELTIEANDNGNISKAEFNKMKAQAVKYLMGMLLSGEIDETLVNNLGPKYINLYNDAKEFIQGITESSTPEQVQTALTKAEALLNQFIDKCGGDNLAKAVTDTKASKAEDAAGQILDKWIDTYFEQHVNAGMTDEQQATLKAFLTNCKNKFISKCAEEGTLETTTDKALQKSFESYVNAQLQALEDFAKENVVTSSQITGNFDSLVAISNKAKENNYISDEEKADIIDAATKLIVSQLMSGVTDIVFLDALDPYAKSSSEWREVEKLMNTLQTSVDPDELKDISAKIQEQIKALLEKYDGKKLVNAVDTIKPVKISDNTKENALFNSSIYADYEAAASRTTDRCKQDDDSLKTIQEMARKDMEAYAEALKAQLKKEYGDAYNESEVERFINDAINDTLAIFTSNIYRDRADGHDYSTKPDERAFRFGRTTNSHKGRYAYNVKALIDTFVECFNNASKQKAPWKLDPSLATYDKENAIYATEGLGNDYYKNKSETEKGSSRDDQAAYARLIQRATDELKRLGEQVKLSLKTEGLDVPDDIVDDWIQECIKDTIADMKKAFQYCAPDGSVSGGFTADDIKGQSAWRQGLGVGAQYAGGVGVAVGSSLLGGVLGTGVLATAVPIVGWAIGAVAIVGASLKQWTNVFGATWGQHQANAGFYFERKSNSHSGQFGYDTQTLVDLFLNKIDKKLYEWKKQKEEEKKAGKTADLS